MHAFRSFMLHKFTIRQSVLIIVAAVAVALAANQAAEAANLPGAAVNAAGFTAAFATFIPLQIVFYRRASA